jgi:Uma2 family endonuclease
MMVVRPVSEIECHKKLCECRDTPERCQIPRDNRDVSIPAQRGATYEDLLRLPEHVVGEILDGELHVSPRPAPRHANAESTLVGELVPPFHHGRGGPGGWWILAEPELHFGRDVVVPDIAGWRRERMPSLPETAWFEIAPDWICEIISPATGRIDRVKKLPIYAREKVSWAWVVDPLLKTVEILKLNSAWTLMQTFGGDDKMTAPPFDAIEIDLRLIWGEAA